jgi:hypothetical protein
MRRRTRRVCVASGAPLGIRSFYHLGGNRANSRRMPRNDLGHRIESIRGRAIGARIGGALGRVSKRTTATRLATNGRWLPPLSPQPILKTPSLPRSPPRQSSQIRAFPVHIADPWLKKTVSLRDRGPERVLVSANTYCDCCAKRKDRPPVRECRSWFRSKRSIWEMCSIRWRELLSISPIPWR